jgi:hypothetical protein
MIRFLSAFFLVILSHQQGFCQLEKRERLHSPKKATLMSTILPGAGQAYNRKYWKIPIIYGGFAGLAYAINFNNKQYREYKRSYSSRLDNDITTIDPYVGIYSDNDLVTLKDFYRRNRDLSIVGLGLLYVLNIVDASVDAHLFEFNVNDDLSLHVTPITGTNMLAGVGLRLGYR